MTDDHQKNDPTLAKKKRILIIAVAITSAIIIICWLILLPSQLQRFSLFDGADGSGWSLFKNQIKKQNDELKQTLTDLRASLNQSAAPVTSTVQEVSSKAAQFSQDITKHLQDLQDKETGGDSATTEQSATEPNSHDTKTKQ